MTKTRDGILLEKVVRAAEGLGLSIKEGSRHKYLLLSEGMIPCPVAASTDVKRMVVPWIKKATGYSSGDLYLYLKKGKRRYEC